MKIDRMRNLSNNIFSSKLIRVADDDQSCVLIEKKLEDDFGPVEIQIGGLIEIVVKLNSRRDGLDFTPVTSEHPKPEEGDDNVIIAYQIPSERQAILMNTTLQYECNAALEVDRTILEKKADSLRIAEEKCKAFEAVMLDRLKLAVDAWKAKKTSFEDEALAPVHFNLSE